MFFLTPCKMKEKSLEERNLCVFPTNHDKQGGDLRESRGCTYADAPHVFSRNMEWRTVAAVCVLANTKSPLQSLSSRCT